MKNRVCLLLIATGKYDRFLPGVLASVKKYFLNDCLLDIHVFADCATPPDCHVHRVEHNPFPYSTLNRFHFFKAYAREIYGYDYYFYLDVDTLIKDEITSEILSPRTAVQHCGFVRRLGSFEDRPESKAYVTEKLRMNPYFGGGFWGFAIDAFWKLVDDCIYMIESDKKNGIVAIWNDESYLNKHLIENAPSKILTPSYHYPEGNIDRYKKMWYPDNYECKILLLDKDHEELRS